VALGELQDEVPSMPDQATPVLNRRFCRLVGTSSGWRAARRATAPPSPMLDLGDHPSRPVPRRGL